MKTVIGNSILEFFLPDDTLTWFDITSGTKDDENICVILEEKNDPPLKPKHKGKKITSNGFKEINIRDYPIRGRAVSLTSRRRSWKVEGEDGLLKRDIHLVAEGTKLEKEFADFLKEGSRK